MEVTRKGFISSVSGALVAAALPKGHANAAPHPAKVLIGPAASRFAPHIGSSFSVATKSGNTATVVLRDVVEQKSHPRTEQFSLVFATRNGARLEEGTYAMRHPSLGAVTLFLAPMGQAAREKSEALRADFNLLKA